MLVEKANDFSSVYVIFRVIDDLHSLPGTREFDVEDLADVSFGSVGQHDNPIAQQQGFIDIVRHHDTGGFIFLANGHQLFL